MRVPNVQIAYTFFAISRKVLGIFTLSKKFWIQRKKLYKNKATCKKSVRPPYTLKDAYQLTIDKFMPLKKRAIIVKNEPEGSFTKISKACGALAKVRNCVKIDVLKNVYHVLFHSYIRYGIVIWGHAACSSSFKYSSNPDV